VSLLQVSYSEQVGICHQNQSVPCGDAAMKRMTTDTCFALDLLESWPTRAGQLANVGGNCPMSTKVRYPAAVSLFSC